MSPDPRARLTTAAVLGLFGLYLLTLCPTVHWLDSGELSLGAFQLSVPHPPGEPVWVMLAKGAALLPVGDVAQRLGILSALAAALVPVAGLGVAVTWGILDGERSPALAVAAAAAPCVTYPLWVQAVRPEVYSLHLLLTLATLAALGAAGRERPRAWMLAALLGGLAAGVHPLLAGLALLPAIALAALTRGLPRGGAFGATAGLALLGLAAYAALPVRTAAGAHDAWGQPSTAAAFLDTFLARTFQQNFVQPTADLMRRNLVAQWETVAQGSGWLVPVAALGGLWALALTGRARGAALAAGVIAGTLGAKLTQSMVFSTNVDLHGYLSALHACLWLLAAGGAAVAAQALPLTPRLRATLPALSIAALAAMAGITQAADASRAGDDLARLHARAAFEAVPPGGTLITSGNNTMFISLYLQGVEGYRPDVRAVHRSLVGHPWYRARWRDAPRPAPLAWVDAARGRPSALGALGGPVVLEVREHDLVDAGSLCPATADPGWGFYAVVPEGACPPPRLRGRAQGLAAYWGPFPGDVDARLVEGLAADVLSRYRAAWGVGPAPAP